MNIEVLHRDLLAINDKQLFLQQLRNLNRKILSKIIDIDNGEILYKATKIHREHCRTCNHQRSKHESDANFNDRCHDDLSTYAGCECLKFIPPDNLEFLEMKALDKSR